MSPALETADRLRDAHTQPRPSGRGSHRVTAFSSPYPTPTVRERAARVTVLPSPTQPRPSGRGPRLTLGYSCADPSLSIGGGSRRWSAPFRAPRGRWHRNGRAIEVGLATSMIPARRVPRIPRLLLTPRMLGPQPAHRPTRPAGADARKSLDPGTA